MSSDSFVSFDLCKGTRAHKRSERLHPGRGKTQARPGLSSLLSAAFTSSQMSGRRAAVADGPALGNLFFT